MNDVHVWRTLTGVLALTPEGIGCSTSSTAESCEQIQADLEARVRMSERIGFFGGSYSLEKLIALESPVESRTVYFEASVETGRICFDLTFERIADRNEFIGRIMQLLGDGWKLERSAKKGLLLWVLPTLSMIIGILAVFYSGVRYFFSMMSRHNARPADPPTPEDVARFGFGFGIAMIVFAVVVAICREVSGGMQWERICRR